MWGDCDCRCNCCPDDPIVELTSWIGQRLDIPTDLTTYRNYGLTRLPKTGTIWALCLKSTGNIPSGTSVTITQGGPGHTVTAPYTFGVATTVSSPAGKPKCFRPIQLGLIIDGEMQHARGSLTARTITLAGRSAQGQTAAGCPTNLDLVMSGSGSIHDLEFCLVSICVCCADSHLAANAWWSNFEGTLNYTPSSHDELHTDYQRCVGGTLVSRRAPCEPRIHVVSRGIRQQISGTEYPAVNIEGLRTIYGANNVSFSVGTLATQDLSRIELIWLGSANTGQSPCGATTGLEIYQDWLDTGNKMLVLDWGTWQDDILSGLGLTTTVEPLAVPDPAMITIPSVNYLIDPATAYCSGRNAPFYGYTADPHYQSPGTYPDPVRVVPQPHVLTGAGGSGTLIDFDFVIGYPAPGFYTFLTYIPVVTPGPSSIILGRAQGHVEMSASIGPINYPAIVLEPWPGNPTSFVLIAPVSTIVPAVGGVHVEWHHLGLSWNGSSAFLENLYTKLGQF